MTNEQIALALEYFADALEDQEDNPYRIRAYRRGAYSIRRYEASVAEMVFHQQSLMQIPHVGEGLADKIQEIVLTANAMPVPKMRSPHTYPIKKSVVHKTSQLRRDRTDRVVKKIISRLQTMDGVQNIQCAGDYRRKKEVVDKLAIIVLAPPWAVQSILDQFLTLPFIKYLVQRKAHTLQVVLKLGIPLTLYVVNEQRYGAKLLHITGSVSHYKALQKHAIQKQLRLTPQGLFKNKSKYPTESESRVYQALDLPYIPPELREDRGEIQAALKKRLPKLVVLSDIKGDLHCHTNETDGSFTLEEMVEAARQHGYQYVAITDHSKALRITNGLDEKRLLQQIKRIDQLNEKMSDFVILKSIEVDILEGGELDLSNAILKELDLTVCSIHSKFHLSLEKQTERIIRAMDNSYFNILGHATGRLIHHRPPYALDMDAILKAAKDRHCFIEVNAQPARLDINDWYCKKAKDMGVKVAISSDAHTISGFHFMELGIQQARRGWLEASDVINTYSWPHLKKILKRI